VEEDPPAAAAGVAVAAVGSCWLVTLK